MDGRKCVWKLRCHRLQKIQKILSFLNSLIYGTIEEGSEFWFFGNHTASKALKNQRERGQKFQNLFFLKIWSLSFQTHFLSIFFDEESQKTEKLKIFRFWKNPFSATLHQKISRQSAFESWDFIFSEEKEKEKNKENFDPIPFVFQGFWGSMVSEKSKFWSFLNCSINQRELRKDENFWQFCNLWHLSQSMASIEYLYDKYVLVTFECWRWFVLGYLLFSSTKVQYTCVLVKIDLDNHSVLAYLLK